MSLFGQLWRVSDSDIRNPPHLTPSNLISSPLPSHGSSRSDRLGDFEREIWQQSLSMLLPAPGSGLKTIIHKFEESKHGSSSKDIKVSIKISIKNMVSTAL